MFICATHLASPTRHTMSTGFRRKSGLRSRWRRTRSRSGALWKASSRFSKPRGARPRRWRRSPTRCSCPRIPKPGSASCGRVRALPKIEAFARGVDHDVGCRLDAESTGIDTKMVVVECAPVAIEVAPYILLALLVPLVDFMLGVGGVDPAVGDRVLDEEPLRRVAEDMQRILALGQQRLRAPAHQYRVPALHSLLHDALRHADDARLR